MVMRKKNKHLSTGYAAVVFLIFYVYNVLEVFMDSLVPQAQELGAATKTLKVAFQKCCIYIHIYIDISG